MKHQSVTPSSEGLAMIGQIRNAVEALDELITKAVPNGDERRNALSRLSECRMWAIQGTAHNNQQR